MKAVVDNFDLIASLLPEKADEDPFWVIRIIGRKKDNPNLPKNSKFYKAYTVQSRDELIELKGKIIECAAKNFARAYFNPNARSWKKVAMATLKRIADYIAGGDYKSVQFAADRSLDEGAAPGRSKIWVIDLDEPKQEEVTKSILKRMSVPVIAEVPTVSGKHLLVHPFNPNDLWELWHYDAERPEIKKNNPTLLYFNRVWDDDDDFEFVRQDVTFR